MNTKAEEEIIVNSIYVTVVFSSIMIWQEAPY